MFETMQEVIAANEAIGHCFFRTKTRRFFRSRIARNLYGGKYFITSEKFNDNTPRLYTVRSANSNGSIKTVGRFQQYESRNSALCAITRFMAWGEEYSLSAGV